MRVFISYTSADRNFVEKLARHLIVAGIPVWYDQWELSIGDSLRDKISVGIQGAAFLAVVLSKASVQSKWVKDEVYAAMARGDEEQRVMVLPLLIEGCDIPPLLKDKVYVDFRTDYEASLRKLIERVRVPGTDELGRVRGDEYITDYAFDWGTKEGRHHFRLYIVSHSPAQPAAFLCTIEITPSMPLDKRLSQYERAGLTFLPRLMIAATLSQYITSGSARLVLDNELPGHLTIDMRERHGLNCTLTIEARRLGRPSEKAQLYDVGDVTKELFETMAADLKAQLTPEEEQEWIQFLLPGLAGSQD